MSKDAQGSTCTDVSTEIAVMHGRKCSDISTKIMVMYRGTCTDVSMINTVVCGSTCANDKYRIHRPKREIIEPGRRHIFMDAVGEVQNGLSCNKLVQHTHGF